MCDANSSEMVNGLPVKEESEVSLIEDRSREVKETGNGDALFETKEVEDVTIKEEYPYDEEHMVIVDPLLTFQCKHCKKVFTTQCDLDFHMKEKHTEAKLLSCTMCSETFLEESDLMMHAKFHNHGNPCIIKSSPLLPDQLLQLVLLIKEREGILFGNKRGPILSARKTHTWAEIATLFNAKNLGQGALSVQQIKEAWEYICKRVREAEAAHLKQHGAAGDVPLMSTFTAPYMQLASHILTRECISGNQAPEECQSQDEPSANTPRTSSSPPRPKYRKILPNVPPPPETQDSESSFGENDHSESEEENSTGSLDPGRSSQPEQAEANAKPKDGNGTAVVSSMKDLLGSVSSTVGHQVLFTNMCVTRERPTVGSGMQKGQQEDRPERSSPLTESQQECLVALIRDKKDVVLCKSQEPKILNLKKRVWKEVAENFNSLNPGQKPRKPNQLKRSLDHIKRRVKEEQSKYRRRVLANEGGLPPDPPKFTEAMMSAMEIMGQELSINDISFVSATMPNANKDGPTHMATTELEPESSSTPAVNTTDAVPSNSASTSPVVPSTPSPSLEFSAPHVPSTSSIPMVPGPSRPNKSSSGHPAQHPNRQSDRDPGKKKSLQECYQIAQESQDDWLQTKKRLLEAEHQEKMKLYEKAGRLIDSVQQHIDSLGHSFSLFLAAGQKAYAEMAESYKRTAEKK